MRHDERRLSQVRSISCPESEVIRVASYTINEWLLALVPFGQGRPFEKGAIALEALSEATNGDAEGVVMNPACQLTKLFEAQPTADSADEKGGLACAGARSR